MKLYIYLFFKRVFDIIFGLLGFIILIPLSFLIKILSMLTLDFHSIFFIQERVGLNGKVFKMLKYRTMVIDADKVLDNMLSNDSKKLYEYGKFKKLNKDPRITKIGNFLRMTSIDEFPQFINVLFGQMSLVGPRPYLVREKDDMGKYYDIIVKAKPGITGYWQVNGRNNIKFKRRLKLESKYVLNRSLWLDFKIVIKTFLSVLKRDGAI